MKLYPSQVVSHSCPNSRRILPTHTAGENVFVITEKHRQASFISAISFTLMAFRARCDYWSILPLNFAADGRSSWKCEANCAVPIYMFTILISTVATLKDFSLSK
jgi:hypothetical protein